MRAAIAASLLLLVAAQPAKAQDDQVDDIATDVEQAPESAPVLVRVRLTYYLEAGRTYSGQQTYAGSTACSWNFPIGTRFVFRDGETVTCIDRGLLGSSGWLDVWRQPALSRKYGAWADVSVVP